MLSLYSTAETQKREGERERYGDGAVERGKNYSYSISHCICEINIYIYVDIKRAYIPSIYNIHRVIMAR